MDLVAFEAELEFLQLHPEFDQRPATILEFLGPDYLNIADRVRPGLKHALLEIFGREVNADLISVARRAMFTGGIGIGKTTFASIVMPYMVHHVSCLRNPQEHYDLMDGSRIAFMLMSTTESQARQVLFSDIKARIQNSPWFKANCLYDDNFKNQLRFPKDIWILPGNSQETTFEGYNILGGVLDEGDSHKSTKDKDFAEAGYDTMHSRIDSRFNDPKIGDHRGLLIVIGQMKKSTGFMAKKKAELEQDANARVVSMSIWESHGWGKYSTPDGLRDSFYYDVHRKAIVPQAVVDQIGLSNENLIEVPNAFRKNFANDPEKALRDLAGIPPAADSPFISLVDRIDEAQDRWEESHMTNDGPLVPVGTSPIRPELASWVRAVDSLPRTLHIDIAISAEGDALGLAMGHVSSLAEVEDELKPYITFDFLMRVKAAAGTEIFLSDIRNIIYDLKDERGFKIAKVTMDGYQSTDTRQQLSRRRIPSEYLSVDRSVLPYYDLKEAIYERRVEFPRYMTVLNQGDVEQVDIVNKELRELSEEANKIDHPKGGSKDVADAMAGVVYTLMGDRKYRRVARAASRVYDESEESRTITPVAPRRTVDPLEEMLAGLSGMSAPIPPTSSPTGSSPFWR